MNKWIRYGLFGIGGILIILMLLTNSEKIWGGLMALIGILIILSIAIVIVAALAKSIQQNNRLGPTGATPQKSPWQKFLESPTGKNLTIAIVLIVLYLIIFWLLYGPITNSIQNAWGLTERAAWLIITILGLAIMAPALWLLFEKAGIPGDPAKVRKGLRAMALAIVLFLAYSYYHSPEELFDPESGQAQFWVNESGEVFRYPTDTEDTVRYSPKTGLPLRKGRPEDASIALKSNGNPLTSVAEFLEKKFGKVIVPVDTVILGPGMIDPPKRKGWKLYIIEPGDDWSGIRYDQTGRIEFHEYSFLTEEPTSLQCQKKDTWNERTQTFESGKWKIPVPDGKDYYHSKYFEKSRALRWKQLPEEPIYILANWI